MYQAKRTINTQRVIVLELFTKIVKVKPFVFHFKRQNIKYKCWISRRGNIYHKPTAHVFDHNCPLGLMVNYASIVHSVVLVHHSKINYHESMHDLWNRDDLIFTRKNLWKNRTPSIYTQRRATGKGSCLVGRVIRCRQ